MNNSDLVLGYDYDEWYGYGRKIQIVTDISPKSNSHILLCGMSGSGKSYGENLIVAKIATLGERSGRIYFADFKQDDQFIYMRKCPRYAEKEEKILFTMGMETIQDTQGKRNDLEEIERLLKEGSTPEQIFDSSFRYRKFEKMIKAEYIHNRIKSTPIIKKNLRRIWIVGDSGTGKSHFYTELAKEVGIENIYFATDFENGGLDYYIENGAPEILFLDEFKGNMKFSQLLVLLDKYSRAQLHCRYSNCFCLWTTVVITSVFPPDEVYTYMVDDAKKKRDRVEQLLRRLDEIWYKYKENGVYKTYKIPAEEYIDYDDLKSRASKDGFVPVDEYENVPFDS